MGAMGHVLTMRLAALFSRRRATFFIAKFNKADMETLRGLLASGKIAPVIDRRFSFEQAVDTFHYLGDGHPQGRVVLTVLGVSRPACLSTPDLAPYTTGASTTRSSWLCCSSNHDQRSSMPRWMASRSFGSALIGAKRPWRAR